MANIVLFIERCGKVLVTITASGHLMNLNDTVLFVKVADLKGISSAAREMNIPKSKVSRRIKALEDSLGVRLIERTTRAIKLTEVGTVFYRHCRTIVEEAENAKASIDELTRKPTGLLRLSTSVGIGQHLLAPYLSEFNELYPEIELDINLNNRRVDLIAEGFDLVIRVGQLEDSSLISRKLGETVAHLYASNSYIEQYGSPNSLEALKQHRVMVMSDGRQALSSILTAKSKGLDSVDIRPSIAVNDLTILKKMVAESRGIAALPKYMVNRAELHAIQRVLPEWSSQPFKYYALYPSRMGLTKKARAWIEFFAKKMAVL